MFKARREAKRQRFIRNKQPVVPYGPTVAVQEEMLRIVKAELVRVKCEPDTPGFYTALEWSL